MKSFTVMAIALLGLTNAATIRICKDQTLGNCVTMDVGGCTNFPGNMNDVVSSVDTGSATCTFFTDGSCGGASWTTRGLQNTVPSNFNDKLSSVRC
ncbi:hypothetical protein HER10_EVM0007685 [Colletotrichum scovillei]|uniref:Small secreted protein n=1 Tax=Colletotrichum scovillei TaxID=1209932 RepID=A0A9P7R033_9PEZI|nr:uncharacterized protein HER10_EVM0007685 [Colletotrichum scovillei]KAF4781131.1 hypothetical protein HER10_EVM0007685 [Colletotrichum scovillei]KAG7045360.1 putative small secreted protein [Colletotrichum scovillei]KAG7052522.1 putative small secreted protein [Colletotrichum scovillei]KAG7064814.1 putative small secreted protein [Colletotrichum scovillei]